MHVSLTFFVLALIAVGWQLFLLLMALFEPALRYKVECFESPPIDSEEFLRTLEALTDAQVNHRSEIQVLTNGEQFYAAELNCISQARESINLEAYIFQQGEVARRFVAALAERAAAGVKVNVTMDGLGSLATSRNYCRELLDAGGKIQFYHPLSWKSVARFNNRTHRELLIVDGRIAFIGGAGIADHWLLDKDGRRRWRDTVTRVEGDAVCNLQATFAENWLETSGEVLFGKEYFPACDARGATKAMVVNSSPSAGGSTRARILFQALVSGSRSAIYINSPYFLPDKSMLAELIRAVKRGVDVRIIVPGRRSDHALTRSSSRRLYGDLLRAGAHIYEYQPGMIHAKVLLVDGQWSVMGSTNFDNRSFGLNDEVNLAARDPELAGRLEQDFTADLAQSQEITLKEWSRRPLWERLNETLGRVLERQQ
ncbi:MAG TPA: phospholipase D-like domain-containing protein [Candidatus Angelobacter sp.]|jgi:cardiolipin synthase|nr:phospholipase D-like domain-containing protein [Candidatus Angelobacter sp.]